MSSEVMNVEQLADFLQVSKSYVYQMARKGTIPCARKGKRYLFLKESVLAWVKKDETGLEEGVA